MTVLSPTLDAAYVESSRWLLTELVSDGTPVDVAAEFVAQHLADVIHLHRRDVWAPGNVTLSRSVPDRHDATEAADR